ncbi:hypothetical protein LQV63_16205 [Paenibacillus profundus]|uniref:RNA polymerase sigma factor 70 region 4 type 2 domain-containing protein n=1 Tax=Paenibacillus profundus TaxID=1173085 RepID=A0ABS8YI71_9BACL|nr:sigma-70 family RNA polymerase sigma factor [Paenibacillus profundus]MCE5170847.1 hypothetical protein [Paenibacillus profundus]
MDAYGGEVYLTALLLLRDKHTSEDMAQEVFLTVYRKIGQLSYPYREVVVLHYFHDKSVAEMSDMLGTSEGTVRFRLSRAIACGCFGMLLIVAPLWLPFAASSYVKTDAVPGQQQITYIVEGKWLVREDLLSRGEKDAYR